jgi:hypothetical protein
MRASEKRLDRVFARFIRERDRRCVLCGKAEVECGHLFTRAAKSTRWDDRYAFGQCHFCNDRHERDSAPFIGWFIREKGAEAYCEGVRLHNTIVHWTEEDIERMLAKYGSD